MSLGECRLRSLVVLLVAVAAACSGAEGPKGPAGDPGVACSVEDAADGNGHVITCGSTKTTVLDGENGAACTVANATDGTGAVIGHTVTCGGQSATILNGETGDIGPTGPTGTEGTDGSNGADGADGLVLADPAIKTLVVNNLVFGVDAASKVTARFEVTDGATAVTGLTNTATNIYLAGLLAGANGASAEWQYWPGIDDATLVEGPAGTYLLTSNKLSTDAPAGSTAQRGFVRVARAGLNTGVKGYDFAMAAPATAIASGKDVVNDASCKECHGFGVTIHAYGRNDAKLCVVCHSPNYKDTIASHEADMVTMVHQIHTNKAATLGALHEAGHGENWPTVKYPGTMLSCTKCHNTVAQASNWKDKPTKVACDSCHTAIKFDGTAFTGIKGAAGEIHNFADNSNCLLCHGPTGQAPVEAAHKPAPTLDASQRTMESAISKVAVDAAGGVTVTFTVTDAGAAVTDPALFAGLNFTLTKLVPGVGDAPSHWQSYLSKMRTKDAAKPPVLQGRNEAYPADGGTLARVDGTNDFTYKFALLNASTPGDIRTIDHVHNSSTITGPYSAASLPTMAFTVPYEPNLTHRVGMGFAKVAAPKNIDNKTNAFFDFVPEPIAGVVATTRNIVSRDACNKCHGDSKLHAGYAIEYCVGCHNQTSFDPYSGIGSPSLGTSDTAVLGSSAVVLERVIHKIHMGKDLVNGFVINGSHDYSDLQFPSGARRSSSTPNASNCTVCHDETNAAMTDAGNWQFGNRACGSCHDGIRTASHIAANTFDPTPSATPASFYSGDEIEACTICHTPGGLAPVDEAHLGVIR